jgi:hypothetical protein
MHERSGGDVFPYFFSLYLFPPQEFPFRGFLSCKERSHVVVSKASAPPSLPHQMLIAHATLNVLIFLTEAFRQHQIDKL